MNRHVMAMRCKEQTADINVSLIELRCIEEEQEFEEELADVFSLQIVIQCNYVQLEVGCQLPCNVVQGRYH